MAVPRVSNSKVKDTLTYYSKAFAAFVVPLAALAATLGPILPATQSAPITAGVAFLTGLAAYLVKTSAGVGVIIDDTTALGERLPRHEA